MVFREKTNHKKKPEDAYLWIGDAPDGIRCWYEMDAGGWLDAVSALWPTWTERIAASISFRRGHHYKPLIFNKLQSTGETKRKIENEELAFKSIGDTFTVPCSKVKKNSKITEGTKKADWFWISLDRKFPNADFQYIFFSFLSFLRRTVWAKKKSTNSSFFLKNIFFLRSLFSTNTKVSPISFP